MPDFLTRYDRRRVVFESTQPSMTETADFAQTLIPNIFAAHGCLPDAGQPMFGDFSRMPLDPAEARARLDEAQEQFDALPSRVRERFSNDPLRLIRFLDDPANRDEAVSLGLVAPPDNPSDVSPAAAAAPAGEAGSPSST